MKPIRIVVCGGRDFSDRALIYKELDRCVDLYGEPVIIVSGLCRGADRIARDYTLERKLCFEGYPADWEGLGKRAGYLRNKAMAEVGDVLLAFPGGKGTQMMLSLAKAHGLEIHEVSKQSTLETQVATTREAISEAWNEYSAQSSRGRSAER